MTNLAKIDSAKVITYPANPHTPAAASLVDPDMPADMIILGRTPWSDYWHVEEGATITGELITLTRRYDDDDDGNRQQRFGIVLRVFAETKCSRLYKGEEESGPVRGKLHTEKDRGIAKTWDIYTVPAGTLVATSLRKILLPLVTFCRANEAHKAFVKVIDRKISKGNAKLSYWDMKFAAAPLGYARDTSIDYLAAQAEFIEKASAADMSDIPFLGTTCGALARKGGRKRKSFSSWPDPLPSRETCQRMLTPS